MRDTHGGDQKYHMYCDIYVHCNLKYDIPVLICDYYHKNKLTLLPTSMAICYAMYLCLL